MTDNTPTPSVQPVRAWAVVDKDGTLQSYDDLFEHRSNAVSFATLRNFQRGSSFPHRVVRVEIREVNDE